MRKLPDAPIAKEKQDHSRKQKSQKKAKNQGDYPIGLPGLPNGLQDSPWRGEKLAKAIQGEETGTECPSLEGNDPR
jgi:hypothetical protein